MAVTLGGIALPDDIVWLDEFAHQQVGQARERTLTGAQVIEETALTAGRPITLGGGVWVARSMVLALRTLAADAAETHTLDLRGDAYSVALVRPNPMTATPVVRYANPEAADFYDITLRLITV